jgi:SAM-dependent methyltransferase
VQEERALSFSRSAQRYDQNRAGYPPSVYETIGAYLPAGRRSRILEIGAGSGLASQDVLRYLSPRLTLVEPGHEFVPLLREKFAACPDVAIVNARFEELAPGGDYDAVLSASAFDWVPAGDRYRLAAAHLKPDGVLALFWNNYSRGDGPVFDALAETRRRYHPLAAAEEDGGEKEARRTQGQEIEGRRREVDASGYFTVRHVDLFRSARAYTADGYVALLKTFSINAVQPQGALDAFYARVQQVIDEHGVTLVVPILVDLIVAVRLET